MIDSWSDPPDGSYNECKFCGDSCELDYCSGQCKKAYEAEN